MKYHLSPTTGEPRVCRAELRACPVGGEHYADAALARAAFEARQGGSFSDSHNENSPHLRAFTQDDHKTFTRVARELLDHFSPHGDFELPEEEPEYDEEEDRVEIRVGDFRLLASGAAVNAYLHEPSGMVYKIPHFESVGELWSTDTSNLLVSLAKADKATYESLDPDELEAKNLVYTPTRYFGLRTTKGPVPIIVQAYLDPEAYEPHSLTGTEQNQLASDKLWDFNMGNVRLHRASGKLVLIDCIRQH